MKKILLLILFVSPGFLFGEPFSIPWRVTWDSSFQEKTFTNNTDFVSSDLTAVQLRYLSKFVGVRFYTNSTFFVSMDTSSSSTVKFTNPVLDHSSGKYTALRELPIISSAYTLIAELYRLGFVPSFYRPNEGYVDLGTRISYHYINTVPIQYITQALMSTNDVYRSTVLSRLSSIDSSLSRLVVSVASIESIVGSLGSSGSSSNLFHDVLIDGQMTTIPQSLYYSPAFDSLNSIDNGALLSDLLSLLGFEGNVPHESLQDDYYKERNSFFKSFGDSFVSSAFQAYLLDKTQNPNSEKTLNDFASDLSSTLQTLGSFSFSTPLTNALQGLDGEWKQKVKDTLQDVHDDITNRLDKKTWAGYVDKTTNALDSISRDSSSAAAAASDISDLLKDSQSGDGIRVKLPPGPYNVNVMNWPSDLKISLNKDSLDFMSETVGTIASKWDTWFGYWSSWNSDYFYPSLREQSGFFYNVTNQLNRLLTVSNVLDDILVSITNLDISVTNSSSYMLLSDYADYINSSGLSNLLDGLDDGEYSDFKAAVDSIGHSDVADGYGRWWRYFTGLSTVQANSIFKLSNIFQAHEKLLADLKRYNSDVSDLSSGSVFGDILSQIPSQTDIDDKLSQLTNSIDSTGFTRLQNLIPDLTNKLSLASELYNHDFALPTDIQWVLIPGDSSINSKERIIHINPYKYYKFFQVLHYGIAFSYCIVNILLIPKFLLLLVKLFDRVWNKSEKLIYNSTQS